MIEFTSPARRLKQLKIKWTDTKCSLCKQDLTIAEADYSTKHLNRPLCYHCQRLVKATR